MIKAEMGCKYSSYYMPAFDRGKEVPEASSVLQREDRLKQLL